MIKRLISTLILIAVAASPVAAKAKTGSPPYVREATSGEMAMIAEAADAVLKDAESAKYQNVKVKVQETEDAFLPICGEVNAKNSFGAYAGYEYFFAFIVPLKNGERGIKGLIVEPEPRPGLASSMCRKHGLAD